MNEKYRKLAARVRNELPDLDRLVQRVRDGWSWHQQSGNDLYLDSVALNLHGFYSGLEHLFELSATVVDGAMPSGANWHQVLLQGRAAPIYKSPWRCRPAQTGIKCCYSKCPANYPPSVQPLFLARHKRRWMNTVAFAMLPATSTPLTLLRLNSSYWLQERWRCLRRPGLNY